MFAMTIRQRFLETKEIKATGKLLKTRRKMFAMDARQRFSEAKEFKEWKKMFAMQALQTIVMPD